jgi:cell division initiation protein
MAFLNQIAVEYENKQREIIELKDQNKALKEQVNHFKLIETTLQESAITMQKVIDEKSQEANKEAEFILAQARANALKETESIRSERDDLTKEVMQLKAQRKNFFIRMKSVLSAQTDLLSALESDDQDFLEIGEEEMVLRSKDLSADESLDDEF